MNQSEFKANYMQLTPTAENLYKRVMIGFGNFAYLICWRSSMSFANQSQSVVLIKQNCATNKITFNTQQILKAAPSQKFDLLIMATYQGQ